MLKSFCLAGILFLVFLTATAPGLVVGDLPADGDFCPAAFSFTTLDGGIDALISLFGLALPILVGVMIPILLVWAIQAGILTFGPLPVLFNIRDLSPPTHWMQSTVFPPPSSSGTISRPRDSPLYPACLPILYIMPRLFCPYSRPSLRVGLASIPSSSGNAKCNARITLKWEDNHEFA
jgi:hypothetical protein